MLDDGRVAELGPQPADRRLDRGGERVGRFVPDPLQQFLGGDHPVPGREQALQQRELLRAEIKAPPGTERHPAARVERHVAALERGGQRRGGAAAKSADARGQLGEVERLGQVVVGAQPEAVHPVLDRAGRGQHQDPARRPVGRQPPAYLVAVHSGQVPVQHHDVIAGDGQMLERVVPVENDVDGHALAAKPGPDRLGQDLEVFNYQHSHDLFMILPRRAAARLRDLGQTMPGHRCQAGVSRRHRADTGGAVRTIAETATTT